MADEVIALVNKERKAAGLSSLTKDSLLTEAAQIRAEELAEVFGHTRPDGTSCDTVLEDVGITLSLCGGENVASGQPTAESVMNSWMNSSGHKSNILDSEYRYIGIGVYYSGSNLYWVQIFTGAIEKNGGHYWVKYTYDGTFDSFTDLGETLIFTDINGNDVTITYGDTYYVCSVCGKYSSTGD